jgi:hypothetical protein
MIEKIASQVRAAIDTLVRTKEKAITHIITLDDDDKYQWAIVVAWQDGFEYSPEELKDNPYAMAQTPPYEESDWNICAKIAYISRNSMMSEYDIDWTMPFDGEEVFDTEVSISNPDEDVKYLVEEWEKNNKLYKFLARMTEDNIVVPKATVSELVKAYWSNHETLTNLEAMYENGMTDDKPDESFEQGYNNALDFVFKKLSINL